MAICGIFGCLKNIFLIFLPLGHGNTSRTFMLEGKWVLPTWQNITKTNVFHFFIFCGKWKNVCSSDFFMLEHVITCSNMKKSLEQTFFHFPQNMKKWKTFVFVMFCHVGRTHFPSNMKVRDVFPCPRGRKIKKIFLRHPNIPQIAILCFSRQSCS